MWRKLFSRLSVLSLLLCLATVGWWVRTSSKVDELTYQREDVELLRFTGADGKMVVTHALYDPAVLASAAARSFGNPRRTGRTRRHRR